ncbi:hypothetical protein LLG95_15280 [bacterium]|nr:hypothetical protein [bacterium]
MKTKSSWRWTALWACVLLAFMLLIQYAGGWFAVQAARVSKEMELESHLADLARIAGTELQGPVSAMTQIEQDSAQADTESAEQPPDPELYAMGLDQSLTAPIDRLAHEARLERIVVISTGNRVLYDTAERNALLRPFEYWRMDSLEINNALLGIPEASPAYQAGDLPFKRYYVPILVREESNFYDATTTATRALTNPVRSPRVQALVCLVAGRTYLSEINKLSGTLSRAGIVITLLTALIGLLIFRLLRRQQLIERQVAEADRLASMGTLAAGFAHELRNPLGIMRAYTEDLEHGLIGQGAGDESIGACREIVEEIERMDHLVSQFLDATRGERSADESGAAPAVAVSQGVLSMLRSAAERHGVTIELETPSQAGQMAPAWRARIAPARLRQVIMNLLLNAIQASPKDGRVWLRIEAGTRQIHFSVTDEGPGVPEAIATRIFEPFFTTRPGGAGLGLAVSHQIAAAAGGSLSLANPGSTHGTSLVLTLPRAEDGPPLNHVSMDTKKSARIAAANRP